MPWWKGFLPLLPTDGLLWPHFWSKQQVGLAKMQHRASRMKVAEKRKIEAIVKVIGVDRDI